MDQKPTPRRSVSLFRISMDGAVVVVSILLAFGIDAWWERVSDRRLEIEVLQGLQEEFLQHRDFAARRLEVNQSTSDGIDLLMDIKGTSVADAEQAAEVVGAVRAISFVGVARLRGGVLDALISSGRLELIRDRTLREELSSWSLLATSAEEQDAVVERFVMERLFPHVASLDIPLDRALAISTDRIGFREEAQLDTPSAFDPLLEDQEFFNLLGVRRLWLNGTAFHYRDVSETSARIVDLIARQLAA
jgi:hypothetical protein